MPREKKQDISRSHIWGGGIIQAETDEWKCDQNMSDQRKSQSQWKFLYLWGESVALTEHPQDAQCWEINLSGLCNHVWIAWQEQWPAAFIISVNQSHRESRSCTIMKFTDPRGIVIEIPGSKAHWWSMWAFPSLFLLGTLTYITKALGEYHSIEI